MSGWRISPCISAILLTRSFLSLRLLLTSWRPLLRMDRLPRPISSLCPGSTLTGLARSGFTGSWSSGSSQSSPARTCSAFPLGAVLKLSVLPSLSHLRRSRISLWSCSRPRFSQQTLRSWSMCSTHRLGRCLPAGKSRRWCSWSARCSRLLWWLLDWWCPKFGSEFFHNSLQTDTCWAPWDSLFWPGLRFRWFHSQKLWWFRTWFRRVFIFWAVRLKRCWQQCTWQGSFGGLQWDFWPHQLCSRHSFRPWFSRSWWKVSPGSFQNKSSKESMPRWNSVWCCCFQALFIFPWH